MPFEFHDPSTAWSNPTSRVVFTNVCYLDERSGKEDYFPHILDDNCSLAVFSKGISERHQFSHMRAIHGVTICRAGDSSRLSAMPLIIEYNALDNNISNISR